jgi:hypothetical protein
VKEVEEADPTRPVVVPTPGNVTHPSPVKSLKAPPSNTDVKKPPAATKTSVLNRFEDEKYLAFKNEFKKTDATGDTKPSNTKASAHSKASVEGSEIAPTEQQKTSVKNVFQKPPRAINRMVKEGRTHPDLEDPEFNEYYDSLAGAKQWNEDPYLPLKP